MLEIECPIADRPAQITLEGFEVRGEPAFRGFACEHEAECAKAGVCCALFAVGGAQPFDVAQALRFLGAG
ncbi:MAG: hypothetical protein HS108_06555 [Planctomycetes bacterium]|jgi:hypothetical protein|nr:hypothetical protein [Planctomycetota bacterium]MCL4729533.1 hypothetical protein [Planctomycetota bacterium]